MKTIQYIVLLLLMCSSALVNTQNIEISNIVVAEDSIIVFDGTKTIVCQYNLYIYEDNDQKSIKTIAAKSFQGHFNQLTKTETLKKGQTYWLKFTLKNEFDAYQQLDRYYFTSSNISKYIHLYLEDSTIPGEFTEVVGGALLSQKERTSPNGFFWFLSDVNMELPITTSKHLTYYIKIKCLYDYPSFQQNFHFDVVRFDHIKQSNKLFGYMVLIYVGFLFMMFVYTLGLYSFIREKSFLYYALFCLSMLIYNATTYSITQIIFDYYFPNHPEYELILRLSIYFALISFLLFIMSYLELKKELPDWEKIFKGLIVILLGFLCFESYLIFTDDYFPYGWKQNLLYRIFYILTPVNILMLIFLIPLWKLKTKRKYFLFLGISTLTLGIVYLIYIMLTASGNISREAYAPMLVFSALEMVFFALGLAYRIKENEAEKGKILLDLQQVENEKKIIDIEKKNLQEIDNVKTKLYTNITHDLRTPLTIIQGMTEQITSRKYKQEKKMIERNIQKMLQLVNQILDLAKLEAGKLKLQLRQSDIVSFLKNEMSIYMALATSQNIALQIECKAAVIEMDFDPPLIRQVLANLLSNAFKFIKNEGDIYVRMQKINRNEQPYFLLEIEDTGKGIPENELSKIFDRYYQVDDSAIYNTIGTGIGLAHTKELVHLMGGKIKVKSQLNTGSTFTVILPISQKAIKASLEEMGFGIIENEVNDELSPVDEKTGVIENFDLPIILIVEDNKDMILYLTECLKKHYRTLTASDGKEGIEIALKHIPDLIISDVMMPEVDGFSLTQSLKNDERSSHIPIILLSAKADQQAKIEGLESGADAYIYKPFDRKEMLIRLQKLLELRKKLQRYYSSAKQLELYSKENLSKNECFLKNVQLKVMQHLSEPDYTVIQLAQDVHLDRTQLFRKIKALTGQTVSSYMSLIRLKQAERMLQSDQVTVAEVAYKVGFNDPAYFSRCFSKLFGYPPSELNE